MPTEKLSTDQFAQSIKAKYPQYQALDNATLAQKVIAKYPQYADKVDVSAPTESAQPKESLLSKASNAVNTLFPMKNVGDVIGTELAKLTAPKNAVTGESSAKYVAPSTATLGGVAGDIAQNALYFAPIGAVAGAAEKGIAAVAPKLAPAVAKTAARVATGAAAGYGLDVANSASNNNFSLTPGLGTALGVAAPLAGPALKGAGTLAAHALGATTGTGANVIKTGFEAAKAGGVDRAEFAKALRGNTAPSAIVSDAREAMKQLGEQRSEAYNAGLKKIEDETYTTKGGQTYVQKANPNGQFVNPKTGERFDFEPTNLTTKGIKDIATKSLKSIGLDAKGRAIDFTKRPSLDARNIQKVHHFLYDWEDMTPTGLNQLRQEIAGFRKGGLSLSPSESRFNKYIDNITRNIKDYLGDRVPQVKEMNDKYARQSAVITEIAKGLSLGKTTQTDTAFRKLSSVLRTNNEFRKELLAQLEKEAAQHLPQQIAGQQLSEIMPRGIARQIETGLAGVGLLTGVGIIPLLKAAIFTSPRAVGEMLLALGFTARHANTFAKALGAKGMLLPAFGGNAVKNANQQQ